MSWLLSYDIIINDISPSISHDLPYLPLTKISYGYGYGRQPFLLPPATRQPATPQTRFSSMTSLGSGGSGSGSSDSLTNLFLHNQIHSAMMKIHASQRLLLNWRMSIDRSDWIWQSIVLYRFNMFCFSRPEFLQFDALFFRRWSKNKKL